MRMYCPHFIIFCQKIDAMTKIQFYKLQISVKKVHIMHLLLTPGSSRFIVIIMDMLPLFI